MRPTWDETWIEVARVIGRRSRCVRAQIGAVIVDRSNRVVATGYNGPPRHFSYTSGVDQLCDTFCPRAMNGPRPDTLKSYEDCPSIHAEMNALMHADRRYMESGWLYVTGDICFTCAKAVANSGIAFVMIACDVPASHREGHKSIEFLEASGLYVAVR